MCIISPTNDNNILGYRIMVRESNYVGTPLYVYSNMYEVFKFDFAQYVNDSRRSVREL